MIATTPPHDPTVDHVAAELHSTIPGCSAEHLDKLRLRLTHHAEHDGVLDIAYVVVDSPLGPLLLAASPAGLLRVAFEREGHDHVLAQLAERVSPRILHAPARLGPIATQLQEYFSATRRDFDVPLDLQLARGFRLEVLERLRRIPYGTTASYATVAAIAGSPRAVRAVGTACATNPLPLVVPCHRVVRTDGTMGGYLGGVEAKERLLALEAA